MRAEIATLAEGIASGEQALGGMRGRVQEAEAASENARAERA